MTDQPTPSTPIPTATQPACETPVDPASIANLTATLRADYLAIQNDLEQAQDLAADFQRQLAGKSNEVAHFKALLEKTQVDLSRMEGHVNELRQERHRLANEVMEVTGLKAEIEIIRGERDQFRREAEALRSALTASGGEMHERIKQQDAEINRLRAAFEALRTRHIATVRSPGPAVAGVSDRITELSATVDRLESIIRERPGQPKSAGPGRSATAPADSSDTFIDISFEQ